MPLRASLAPTAAACIAGFAAACAASSASAASGLQVPALPQACPAPVSSLPHGLSRTLLAQASPDEPSSPRGGRVAPDAAPALPAPALRPIDRLRARQAQPAQAPLLLDADRLAVEGTRGVVAEGNVVLRHADETVRAPRIELHEATRRILATGDGSAASVSLQRPGLRLRARSVDLSVDTQTGIVQSPTFDFTELRSGGGAERFELKGAGVAVADAAWYTSCPRDEGLEPDWILRARSVTFDEATQTGQAEGAQLRFLGVPILGWPSLSFPLTDARKSGWLPPRIGLDSRSGFEVAVPYYWSIAPNRDATLTPVAWSRRGLGLEAEGRWLSTWHRGVATFHGVPWDAVAKRSRHAWGLQFESTDPWGGRAAVDARGVSDDDYWADFGRLLPPTSPRLLTQAAAWQRDWSGRAGQAQAYARLVRWQVLQTGSGPDRIQAPYARTPQVGLAWQSAPGTRWSGAVTTEINRFEPGDRVVSSTYPRAWRGHVAARVDWTAGDTSWWVRPRLEVNAARWRLDAADLVAAPRLAGLDTPSWQREAQRVVPTASVDAGMVFERPTRLFGLPLRQTLEPRMLLASTPYRDPSGTPLFDSAERDFNAVSIFAPGTFTGVDRISDTRAVTIGGTSRWIEDETGVERLRLALAQRWRFADQRITADDVPLRAGWSDMLMEGEASLWRPWHFEGAMQFNPDSQRVMRSIAQVRWQPAPLHALSVGYRYARDASEQVELGWQWPLLRGKLQPAGARGACAGNLYGVGRVNHSLREHRTTDALVGFELDTGCWIGRLVVERVSTGRAEATTRLMLQLELTGLSRIGSNPLQALRDNIPGYQLLRDPQPWVQH